MVKMENELKMYRVYGTRGKDYVDEYCEARSAQKAVDKVREWYEGSDRPLEVLEVARVIKGWR